MDGHKAMKYLVIPAVMGAAVAHAEPVEVFGVPLGGKISYSVKACKSSLPPTSTVCWVNKPTVGKRGERSGSVMLPDRKLPEWAVRASSSVTMMPNGTVDRIDLQDLALLDESEIRTSIERRFGSPRELHRPPNGSITRWKTDDLYISMLCSKNGEYCNLNFVSATEAARIDAAQQEAEKSRQSRPLSP